MSIDRLKTSGAHLLAIFASLVMFVPVYLIAVNSLKTKGEANAMNVSLPTSLNWENFVTVVDEGKLAVSFFNSVLYAGTSTVIGTFLAACAAFVLSRKRTRMNRFFYFFLIMGIALPINFFTLTTMMQVTHLINTRHGMIILYSAMNIPFAVFLIYGFVESIPRELDEAAIMDGAGPVQLFFMIILPLLKPVLATAAILSFLGVWNEFIFPLYYLNSSSNWPMTLAIYNFFGQYQQNWNLVSADILLTILPVLIVYLAGQRFVLAGLTGGAVKG